MADRDPAQLVPHCPGDGVPEIWARDVPPVPDIYKADSFTDQGTAPLDASRYTSDAFFAAERERWTRVIKTAGIKPL